MRGEKKKQKKMSICARMSTRAIQEQNAIKKKQHFLGGMNLFLATLYKCL